MTRPDPTALLDFEAATGGLPPAPEVGADRVRQAIARSGRVVVAIDDDPTGTQSVAGVPLVARWSEDDLRWGLTREAPCVFVLANTRSLGADAAARRTREIVRSVHRASELEGVPYVLISRSDSTLRGHFPLEIETIDDELRALTGRGCDGVILCPAYVEADRLTVGDVHWARQGERMVPVGETEYARDSTFGYSSSDLRDFVVEKSGGRVEAGDVLSLDLEQIRGPHDALVERLCSVHGGRVIVVNALCDEDLRAVALAAIAAEDRGRRFIYRTGPSFVRARSGLESPAPLAPGSGLPPAGERVAPGLIVVGSHVPLSTRQLERLKARPRVAAIEVPIAEVLDDATRDALLSRLVEQAGATLGSSHVVLFTSRDLVTGADGEESLGLARRVSRFLVELTRRIVEAREPGFVVAKGGITSSDLATDGLDLHRAWVTGSLFPGKVSMWRAVDGLAARIPFVVFPGNVGDDDSLAEVVARLEGGSGC